MKLGLPRTKQMYMVFNSGLLDRFEKRSRLRHFLSHGEGGDADEEEFSRELPVPVGLPGKCRASQHLYRG